MSDHVCPKCSQRVGAFGGHGNFRDRGDGYCARCCRTRAWHAGTQCFCRYATGMPEPYGGPIEPVQLALDLIGAAA